MARVGIAVLALGLAVAALLAPEAGAQHPMGRRGCLDLGELSLSPDQRSAVREAQSRFRPLFDDFRNGLMGRRVELEALLRDPHASGETIRAKAGEVAELRQQLEAALLDYSLELRAVLEADQVRRWCPPGPDLGARRGRRWSER